MFKLIIGASVIIHGLSFRTGPAVLEAIVKSGVKPDFDKMTKWLGDPAKYKGAQSEYRAVDRDRFIFKRTDRQEDSYVIIPEHLINRCIEKKQA